MDDDANPGAVQLATVRTPLTNTTNTRETRSPSSDEKISKSLRRTASPKNIVNDGTRRQLFVEKVTFFTILFRLVLDIIYTTERCLIYVSDFVGLNRREVCTILSDFEDDRIFVLSGTLDDTYTVDYMKLFSFLNRILQREKLNIKSYQHLLQMLIEHNLILIVNNEVIVTQKVKRLVDIILPLEGDALSFSRVLNILGRNSLMTCIETANLMINLWIEQILTGVNILSCQIDVTALSRAVYSFVYSITDNMLVKDIESKHVGIFYTTLHLGLLKYSDEKIFPKNIFASEGQLLVDYPVLMKAESINIQIVVKLYEIMKENEMIEEDRLLFLMGLTFRISLILVGVPLGLTTVSQGEITLYYQDTCCICAEKPSIDNFLVKVACCKAMVCFVCTEKLNKMSEFKNGGEHFCFHCQQKTGNSLSTITGLALDISKCSLDFAILRKISGFKPNRLNPRLLERVTRVFVLNPNMLTCDHHGCEMEPIVQAYDSFQSGNTEAFIHYCKLCCDVSACTYHSHSVINWKSSIASGACELCSIIQQFGQMIAQGAGRVGNGDDKRVFKCMFPEFQYHTYTLYKNPNALCNIQLKDFPLHDQLKEGFTFSWSLLALLDLEFPEHFKIYFGVSKQIEANGGSNNIIRYDDTPEITAMRQPYFCYNTWKDMLSHLCGEDYMQRWLRCKIHFMLNNEIESESDIQYLFKFIKKHSIGAGGIYLFSVGFCQKIMSESPIYAELIYEIHDLIEGHDPEAEYASNFYDFLAKVYIQKTHYISESLLCNNDLRDMATIKENINDIYADIYTDEEQEDIDSEDIDFLVKRIPIVKVE
jgi:hypothetical protein